MRDRFVEVTGRGIPIIAGSGSDLSAVPSASIAFIASAQAFHWMATPATLEEFHRVLLPSGAVLLIWNTRDRRSPPVAALEALIDEYYTADVPRQQTGQFKAVFLGPEQRGRWSPLEETLVDDGVLQRGDLALMLDRVLSISVISALPAEEKAAVAERIKHILHTHPDTAGKSEYTIPYVTEMYITYKQ